MTRKEEIDKATGEFGLWNVGEAMFKLGTEWADQHPSVDTVKKIVCYALKYTNIMLAEDLENGVEWELLIKKAMEE